MTPKEKAEELTLEFRFRIDEYFQPKEWDMVDYHNIQLKKAAKDCATYAADEVLKRVNHPDEAYLMKHSVNYWTEVKQEIEKL